MIRIQASSKPGEIFGELQLGAEDLARAPLHWWQRRLVVLCFSEADQQHACAAVFANEVVFPARQTTIPFRFAPRTLTGLKTPDAVWVVVAAGLHRSAPLRLG